MTRRAPSGGGSRSELRGGLPAPAGPPQGRGAPSGGGSRSELRGGLVRRPAALVLDMDGTLLDTEPLAARAWGEAAAALGLEFDPALPIRLIGRGFADCRALIVEHHGEAYPTDRLMSGWHAAYDAIVEREGLALKPGVEALFAWLDAEGIARAVATSTRSSAATRSRGASPRRTSSSRPPRGSPSRRRTASCSRTPTPERSARSPRA